MCVRARARTYACTLLCIFWYAYTCVYIYMCFMFVYVCTYVRACILCTSSKDQTFPRQVLGLLANIHVVAVSCGGCHTAVVCSTGRVYTWGSGSDGRLGLPSTARKLVPAEVEGLLGRCISISCGASHTAAVCEDGRAFTWGRGNEGQLGHGTKDQKTVPTEVRGLLGDVQAKSARWTI